MLVSYGMKILQSCHSLCSLKTLLCSTSVESVYPYLSLLDQVLVMTVKPGYGGQKFMGNVMPKVSSGS